MSARPSSGSTRSCAPPWRPPPKNIRAVADAQLGNERRVRLEQGHSVDLREVPVGSAAVYAPGGAAPYPSTVLMGCIPAKTAGVQRVVLATPAGRGRAA